MKKFIAALCLSLFIFGIAHAEEIYDPQHTMLALNMAIVSINRILTTKDRVVLEWEYDNIINRLAFGNIESDTEMLELHNALMDFINGKQLRQEDSQRLKESYARRQREAYYRSMSKGFENFRAPENDSLGGWLGGITISAVSSIGMSSYGYDAEKERMHREIEGGLWQLQKEEIEACHELQKKLLNSSWRLLRQYRLPDEYRLTESNLAKFFKAMDTPDASDRLKMLKMIERDFRVYPPYWFYRARTAFDLRDYKESGYCFGKFNEVWRPVLRKDCYKVEAAEYQISGIIKRGELSEEARDEIRGLAETIQIYSPESDWSSNLFTGLVYFALGEKEKAVTCLEENVLFDYEKEISGAVLKEMRKGSSSFSFTDIAETMRNELERKRAEFLASVKDSELSDVLTKYFASCDVEAFAGFERLRQRKFQESKQHFSKIDEYCDGLFIVGTMYARGIEAEKDYKRASEYYSESAMLGHLQSQFELGNLYYDGGPNLEQRLHEGVYVVSSYCS